MTQSDIELDLDLGTEPLHCTAEEIAGALAGLLREMRATAPFVTAEERETLRLIMSHPTGTLTVGDLFPDFERDPESLTALRRLRTAQFIRPGGPDRWEAGQQIEIKPFARLIWDRLGEAAIFGDAPEEAGDEHPAEGDIDLSLPEVNDPDGVETVRASNRTKAAWDEADVLEYLNDDSPPTLKTAPQ